MPDWKKKAVRDAVPLLSVIFAMPLPQLPLSLPS